MDVMFRILTLSGVYLIFFINIIDDVNALKVNARRSAVPPDLWKELEKLSTVDFMEKYLVRGDEHDTDGEDMVISKNKTSSIEETIFPSNSDNVRPGAVEREKYEVAAGFLTPTDAGCKPKETSAPLPKDSSPDIVLWPQCVTLQRCGGCCGSDLLECAPSEVQSNQITAMRTRYDTAADGSPIFKMEGVVIVPMFSHLSCACRCKVQAHHCRHVEHVYDAGTCSCKCKNENEISKCTSIQKWDTATCGCICRNILECHEDEYFSYTDCSCNKINGDKFVDVENIPNDHPCKSQNCRAGYAPVPHGSACECEPSDDWGSVSAGSIDVQHEEWDKLPGGSNYVSTAAPTTPQRQRPTGRPRPTRRRTVAGRGRVGRRVRRAESEGLEIDDLMN